MLSQGAEPGAAAVEGAAALEAAQAARAALAAGGVAEEEMEEYGETGPSPQKRLEQAIDRNEEQAAAILKQWIRS